MDLLQNIKGGVKIKQIIKNILTELFDYKYFIVVYEAKNKSGLNKGNMYLKTTRLTQLDVKYIKNELSKREGFDKENILIINIFRVGGVKDQFKLIKEE